jgi:hypothetical protein
VTVFEEPDELPVAVSDTRARLATLIATMGIVPVA